MPFFNIFYNFPLTNRHLYAKIANAVEKLNICGSGSVVERHLAKVNVASSNLVFRSKNPYTIVYGFLIIPY